MRASSVFQTSVRWGASSLPSRFWGKATFQGEKDSQVDLAQLNPGLLSLSEPFLPSGKKEIGGTAAFLGLRTGQGLAPCESGNVACGVRREEDESPWAVKTY